MGKIFDIIEKTCQDVNNRKTSGQSLSHGDMIFKNVGPSKNEMTLGLDNYLIAAKKISKGPTMLNRLFDLDQSIQETNIEFIKYESALSKIQFMGTNRAIPLLSAFSQKLLSTYFMLLSERYRLMERKGKIELLSQFISESQVKQDDYVRLIDQEPDLSGYAKQNSRKDIFNHLKFEQAQHEKYFHEQQKLISIQNREIFDFAKLCIAKYEELSRLVAKAIFAFREELELASEREPYFSIDSEFSKKNVSTKSSFKKAVDSLGDAIDSLEVLFVPPVDQRQL